MIDIFTVIPIIVSISAFVVSVFSFKHAKKAEEVKSKWEQVRTAREIFVTVFNLENSLLDLRAKAHSSNKDETKLLSDRAFAIKITMAQHLDYFADLVLTDRIGWDVVKYYITHLIRTGGEINDINLDVFSPNLIRLLRAISVITGRSLPFEAEKEK